MLPKNYSIYMNIIELNCRKQHFFHCGAGNFQLFQTALKSYDFSICCTANSEKNTALGRIFRGAGYFTTCLL